MGVGHVDVGFVEQITYLLFMSFVIIIKIIANCEIAMMVASSFVAMASFWCRDVVIIILIQYVAMFFGAACVPLIQIGHMISNGLGDKVTNINDNPDIFIGYIVSSLFLSASSVLMMKHEKEFRLYIIAPALIIMAISIACGAHYCLKIIFKMAASYNFMLGVGVLAMAALAAMMERILLIVSNATPTPNGDWLGRALLTGGGVAIVAAWRDGVIQSAAHAPHPWALWAIIIGPPLLTLATGMTSPHPIVRRLAVCVAAAAAMVGGLIAYMIA